MATLNDNVLLASGDYLANGQALTPELFTAARPASNYTTRHLWEAARFSSILAGSTFIEHDMGQSSVVRLVAVIKHNLGYLGQWRVRLADTRQALVASPTFDSGWLGISPSTASDLSLPWGEFNWGGVATPLDGNNQDAYLPLTESQLARFIRIDFDDEAQAGGRVDPWVQFSRLWCSNGYQPSFNADYGSEVYTVDDTRIKRSESGVKHFNPLKAKTRGMTLTFPGLPEAELLKRIFGDLFMQLGKTGEVIGMLHPTDPSSFPYEALYGTIVDSGKATHAWWKYMNTSIQIEAQK